MWDVPLKVANSGATQAGKHLHGEFNNKQAELEKAVTHNGITLTVYPGDPNTATDPNEEMLAESMSRSASSGVFYEDSGAADAYVLSAIGSTVAPKAYFDGMKILFYADNANTGASTINVESIGIVDLLGPGGSALVSGQITTQLNSATYDAAAGDFYLDPWLTATQAQVNPGTVTDVFVSPATLHGRSYPFFIVAATQSIPNNTVTQFTSFGAATNSNVPAVTANASSITIAAPDTGGYAIFYEVSGTAPTIYAQLNVNGVQASTQQVTGTTSSFRPSSETVFANLAAGDVLTLLGYQNSGAAANVTGQIQLFKI